MNKIYKQRWKERDLEGYKKYRREAQKRKRKRNPRSYLKLKYRQDSKTMERWLSRCLRNRKSYDKRIGRDFDINLPYVMSVLKDQKGHCAISGVKLVHEIYNPLSASIDRIDQTKGHTKGNIQIICVLIQFAKNAYNDQAVKDLFKQVELNLLYKLKAKGYLTISR